MYAVGAYRLHGAAHWVLQQMRISESKKIQGIHSFLNRKALYRLYG
jgi:hypothetical protein